MSELQRLRDERDGIAEELAEELAEVMEVLRLRFDGIQDLQGRLSATMSRIYAVESVDRARRVV